MGYIRERKPRDKNVRFQAEIRLKGHKTLTATFDRKTDAKRWIQKVESDIRAGRHQLYYEAKHHVFFLIHKVCYILIRDFCHQII